MIYARFEYQEITPDAVQSIQRLGTAFYILFAISIGMIGVGLRKFQKRVAATGNTTALSMICNNTLGSKAKKTFIVTFIIYGVFFSMTSGILVYQPEVVFSYHYGADVPSAHVTPCCGPPGYMPKFVAYLTEHVGINIVPINLLLQIIVSYLVAVNTALAVNAISITKKTTSLNELKPQKIISKKEILDFQGLVLRVPMADNVIEYAVDLVSSTRPGKKAKKFVNDHIEW